MSAFYEALDEVPDAEELAALEREALAAEDRERRRK